MITFANGMELKTIAVYGGLSASHCYDAISTCQNRFIVGADDDEIVRIVRYCRSKSSALQPKSSHEADSNRSRGSVAIENADLCHVVGRRCLDITADDAGIYNARACYDLPLD